MLSAILVPSSASGRVVVQVPGRRQGTSVESATAGCAGSQCFLLFAIPRWRGKAHDEKAKVQDQVIAGIQRENNATVTLSDCRGGKVHALV